MDMIDLSGGYRGEMPTLDFNKIVRVMPPAPLMGYLKITLEDGTVQRRPMRTQTRIMHIEFESAYHSAPWDYDDPDGDGVFK